MMKWVRKAGMGTFVCCAILMLAMTATVPAFAEEEKPEADFSVAILSDYIWRGQELSRDSIVIQPSMTVGYKGFSANLWGNLDTDPYSASSNNNPSNFNETDFTLSYGREFGAVSAEIGYIYYALDAVDDSQEFYLSLGLDTLLSPSLTVYKEFDSYMHWYILAGVSHAFELSETMSLELAGTVSYLESDDKDEYPEINDQKVSTGNEYSGFHDGAISASLPISLGKYFTVTPSLSYVFPLSDDASDEMKFRSKTGDDDNYLIGGVTVALAF